MPFFCPLNISALPIITKKVTDDNFETQSHCSSDSMTETDGAIETPELDVKIFTQVDEERKVEAVKDFYENALGNERIVERLQFISIPFNI